MSFRLGILTAIALLIVAYLGLINMLKWRLPEVYGDTRALGTMNLGALEAGSESDIRVPLVGLETKSILSVWASSGCNAKVGRGSAPNCRPLVQVRVRAKTDEGTERWVVWIKPSTGPACHLRLVATIFPHPAEALRFPDSTSSQRLSVELTIPPDNIEKCEYVSCTWDRASFDVAWRRMGNGNGLHVTVTKRAGMPSGSFNKYILFQSDTGRVRALKVAGRVITDQSSKARGS